MTFVKSINTCFKKYAVFNGRASRSEFWWWQLFSTFVFYMSSLFILLGDFGIILWIVCVVALILPSVSVCVRRLHDINSSGWVALILYASIIFGAIGQFFNESVTLIGVIVGIIFLFVFCTPGSSGENRFGDDPLKS